MSSVKNSNVEDNIPANMTALKYFIIQEFIRKMNTIDKDTYDQMAVFAEMVKNSWKTFDVVKTKKKIFENFKNSSSARLRIQQMEIGDLVIKGDSDISVYFKLAGIIYVSGGLALSTAKPASGQKLLNALSTAFGTKVSLSKIISRIISCFPYIACVAHMNDNGKILYPLPYELYPKCMLTKHFGSIIPKVLHKTSSLDGACCIHALIFVSINKAEDSDSDKLFKDITDSIESLAIKENRKHKILDKFGLTTGVYGTISYSWNNAAWEAFQKTREMICKMDTNTAKELFDLAEKWRKS